MCRLQAAKFSSETVILLLQPVNLKLLFPHVLLGLVTVLVAFQLTLQSAVGTFHLGHLTGTTLCGKNKQTKKNKIVGVRDLNIILVYFDF